MRAASSTRRMPPLETIEDDRLATATGGFVRAVVEWFHGVPGLEREAAETAAYFARRIEYLNRKRPHFRKLRRD